MLDLAYPHTQKDWNYLGFINLEQDFSLWIVQDLNFHVLVYELHDVLKSFAC